MSYNMHIQNRLYFKKVFIYLYLFAKNVFLVCYMKVFQNIMCFE